MSSAHRFLGFGFAAADLLMEIGADGRVVFALGAGETVLGVSDQSLAGQPWTRMFDPADHPMVEALFRGLHDGTRAGPVVVCAAPTPEGRQRAASLTAIRLPQNAGAISCALARAADRGSTGVQSREAFEARAAELMASTTQELELAFVELGGLAKFAAGSADPNRVQAMVAGILRAQAYRGEAPAEVGPDRFALVRGREESTEALEARLDQLLSTSGVRGVSAEAAAINLTGVGGARKVAQALRYALNHVLQEGFAKGLPANLSEALDQATRTTLDRAGVLGAAIKHRRFTLAYQPVVGLKDNALHHHEVLVRFGSEQSPFPTIRMAEEMELIQPLDVAVLEETLEVLKRDAQLTLAVNVSGRSLMSDAFVVRVLELLDGAPEVRGRLMFELTESAAVEDLAAADRRIQTLRQAGCEVCLDDFGAGAASLAYLQQLTLDLLKIDGRYIRDLQHGGRESTFVRHLVNMCAELGVRTLAEMVETPEAEQAVRKAGVDYAQGWLYGRAEEAPLTAAGWAARGPASGAGRLATRIASERRKDWG